MRLNHIFITDTFGIQAHSVFLYIIDVIPNLFRNLYDAGASSAQVLNFGGYSLGVTPLPIPNREVKPQHADGTACAGVWESRSLPRFILQPRLFLIGVFCFNRCT